MHRHRFTTSLTNRLASVFSYRWIFIFTNGWRVQRLDADVWVSTVSAEMLAPGGRVVAGMPRGGHGPDGGHRHAVAGQDYSVVPSLRSRGRRAHSNSLHTPPLRFVRVPRRARHKQIRTRATRSPRHSLPSDAARWSSWHRFNLGVRPFEQSEGRAPTQRQSRGLPSNITVPRVELSALAVRLPRRLRRSRFARGFAHARCFDTQIHCFCLFNSITGDYSKFEALAL